MSKPTTVREAITYLYGALDVARRPRSWIAGALELIETETERQAEALAEAEQKRDALLAYLRPYGVTDVRVAEYPDHLVAEHDDFEIRHVVVERIAGATDPRPDRDDPRATEGERR